MLGASVLRSLILVGLVALSSSGCVDNEAPADPTSPPPSTTRPATTTPAPNNPPPPPPAQPKVTWHNFTYLDASTTPTASSLNLVGDWSKLQVKVRLEKIEDGCAALNNEPPEGPSTGEAPHVVFTNGEQSLEVPAFDTFVECLSQPGDLEKDVEASLDDPEPGTWTATVYGRGYNVKAVANVTAMP